MKNTMQNETVSYALSFKGYSKFNAASRELFMEYGAKSDKQLYNGQQPRDYFMMLQDYVQLVEDLDRPFIWSKVVDDIHSRKLMNTKSSDVQRGGTSKDLLKLDFARIDKKKSLKT